ncbi:MAG: ProQ/FinO family protein [Candidatus Competibacteraceae bacterium]|jgi:ProP effector|nr:ProQ/FinO family protein [Candidatus Competibacteraceae bacterium]
MTEQTPTELSTPTAADHTQLREQARALLVRLTETYPTVFFSPSERQIKPLKRRIHKDLIGIVKEWGYDLKVLKYALGNYTRQLRYQQALLYNKQRIDLQGELGESVSEAHKQLAREQVQQITAKRRQRRDPRPGKTRQPDRKTVSEQKVADLQQKLSRKATL